MWQLFDWLADRVSLEEFVREFRIDREAAAAEPRSTLFAPAPKFLETNGRPPVPDRA